MTIIRDGIAEKSKAAAREERVRRIATTGHGPSALPEKGHERREELSRRSDELAEAGERRSKKLIRVKEPKPDREIERLFANSTDVIITDRRKGYTYKLAYAGPTHNTLYSSKSDGWEVVSGDDPESREHAESHDAAGYHGVRRFGDTILMRLPNARLLELQRLDVIERISSQEAIEPERVAKIMTERFTERFGTGRIRARALSAGQIKSLDRYGPDALIQGSGMKSKLAKQVAAQKVDGWLRQGSIPGMNVAQA